MGGVSGGSGGGMSGGREWGEEVGGMRGGMSGGSVGGEWWDDVAECDWDLASIPCDMAKVGTTSSEPCLLD